MKQHFLRALAASGLLLVFTHASVASDFPEVTVTGGRISGVLEGTVASFKGVPYAAPPLGRLRWKSPAPVIAWKDVRKAAEFGPISIQPPGRSPQPQSEDCLTLNVWAPYPKPAHPVPVLVFIHGGRGAEGSGEHDGGSLARKGAVVVTFNYRLGALGFLAHPTLGRTRNFGLLDQLQVFKWVKSNAAAFGGDPAHVMAFGQSSGADFVSALLASRKARGLISSAILESPPAVFWASARAKHFGDYFADKLGCKTADCLRAQPVDVIMKASGRMPFFAASTDGELLTSPPLELISAGKWAKVPVIAGSNSGEPDEEYACPARKLLQAARAGKGRGAWRFLFSSGEAVHGAELKALFGSGTGPVADAIQDAWVRFAATGKAPAILGVSWPAYEAHDEKHLEISEKPRIGQAYRATLCDGIGSREPGP